jgi:hypothetical protein
MANILIPGALALLGTIIGGTFADIDLAPPLPLRHRSAWTHGPLVPLIMAVLAKQHTCAWWFAVGFLPAYAYHLLSDMAPKKWHGAAKISLFPLPGRLPAIVSFLYLAGSVGTSLYIFTRIIE